MTAIRRHLVIPDTQAKPGTPADHLGWVGQYIVDKKPDVVVHLGDHADMPSLSTYDRGKKSFEGRRYRADIDAANEGFDILNEALIAENRRLARNHKSQWWPERHILLGNHENRIARATEDSAELDGTISTDDLNYAEHGWQVHPFLEPVDIDGVIYSHYFYNPMSGRPFGGRAHTRLNTIGHTFTMGHQQTLDFALRFVNGRRQHALIAGACYLHDEDYKGPQGNAHWRGVIMKNEVAGGEYDISTVTLDYLCRRYEGKPLARFKPRRIL